MISRLLMSVSQNEIHVVGVPVIDNCTKGMKKQVGKSQPFTKESLTKIQDINVKDMDGYKDYKKQLKRKEQKFAKVLNVRLKYAEKCCKILPTLRYGRASPF